MINSQKAPERKKTKNLDLQFSSFFFLILSLSFAEWVKNIDLTSIMPTSPTHTDAEYIFS